MTQMFIRPKTEEFKTFNLIHILKNLGVPHGLVNHGFSESVRITAVFLGMARDKVLILSSS